MDATPGSESFFATPNSPQIVDTDMADTPQNFEHLFFDQAFAADAPLYGENGYPASPFPAPAPAKAHPPATNENATCASSESSAQDSSSDSSGQHTRQTSSRSSHSLHDIKGPRMGHAAYGATGKRKSGAHFAPMGPNLAFATGTPFDETEFSNRAMEAAFDFESAANTPSPLTSGSSVATGPSGRFVAIPQDSPMPAAAMLHPRTGSSTGTRENSPLVRMVSPGFPHHPVQTSHTSPASSDDFLDMTTLGNKMPSFSAQQQRAGLYASPPAVNASPAAIMPHLSALESGSGHRKPPAQLIIHPTPQKSRVETQIPIKMSLYPMPEGVKRLHLPAHTISKPKLLIKPSPEKEPDMLELSTSLVCTSALQDPAKLRKALDRAADGNSPPIKTEESRRASTESAKESFDAEDDPLNGGEVHICAGCINRERKRAARKKSKKPEEEEPWLKDEAKRVIVFNTNEIKDWQEPSASNPTPETTEDAAPAQPAQAISLPDGAMQIDVPMRIACYCRHKSEKMGFQVIFTIKDHEGNLVAQTITNPIMITDDHKTHAASSAGPAPQGLFFDQIALPGGSMIAREPLDNYANGFHRNAHSTNDLPALQNQFNGPFPSQMVTPFAVPQNTSQTTSATMTPRNLSRHASPTSTGNCAKKRKGSGGSIRLPDNLQMTRLPGSSSTSSSQNWPLSAGLPTSPSSGSPYMANFPAAVGSMPMAQQSATMFASPPTTGDDLNLFGTTNRSQSFENLSQMRGMYSLPGSAHPSRAPSPTSSAQMMNATTSPTAPLPAQATFSMNGLSNPQRNPIIHKLIPSEGPKAGGIEVTCLGSGFSNGLEIMFGDCPATTTTFWGETSLVCLLPPAQRAGTVPVTFKHQFLQMKAQRARFPGQAPRPQVLFKYVDDDEQELLRQALLLLNHKMHGTFADPSDIARSIVNSSSSGMGSGSMEGSGHGHRPAGVFDAEGAVLKVLEMIDMDDSPYEPRLNMRRKNGQSILHLAASLGYTRLVAGLLARGANPDLRDANGHSPMHMAAINGHAGIITRLRRARGDPRMRSLCGYTPSEMAANEQVFEALHTLSHLRSQSLGMPLAPGSRASSVSSTFSRRRLLVEESSYEYGCSDESDDEASEAPRRGASRRGTPSQPWARSRRNSVEPEIIEPVGVAGNIFPAAAMAAWRDSLAAQIQQFQQSVSWNFPNLPNLPNLQLPALPSMPTIPENYQAGSMVRRFSSLVPQRSSTPSESDARSDGGKESISRVWDLLTGSALPSPAPPAYEDIYPEAHQHSLDTKTASAARAAADAAADHKCAEIFDVQETATATSSSSLALPVRIGEGEVSEEQRQALVAQREQRMKKLTSDRKLFLVWIPILLFVILAVTKNQLPLLWQLMGNVVQARDAPLATDLPMACAMGHDQPVEPAVM